MDNTITQKLLEDSPRNSDGTPMAVVDLTVDEKKTDQPAGVLQFENWPRTFFAPRLKFNNCIDRVKSEEW